MKRIASTDLVTCHASVCHSFNYASHPLERIFISFIDIPPSDPCPICDKENLKRKERKGKERAMDSCQRQSTTSRITKWRFLEEREMGAKAVAKVVAHSKLVARHSNKDFALSMTAFLMKIVGLWLAKNEQEQRKRRLTLMYTVIAILFGVWVQFRDFYYSWPNFGVSNISFKFVKISKLMIMIYF